MRPIVGVVVLAGVAHADPPPVPVAVLELPEAEEPPIAARDVRSAPLPGEESGRTDIEPDHEGVPRKLGRVALFLPRAVVGVAVAPIRGAAYMQDHYKVSQHLHDWFTADNGNIQIYPTVYFESMFGFDVGVRAQLTNDERTTWVQGRASIGNENRWTAELDVSHRWGPVVVAAGFLRTNRDRDWFFGYGNVDQGDEDNLPVLLNPVDPAIAVKSRYRNRRLRVGPRVQFDLVDNLYLTLGTWYERRFFEGTGNDDSINAIYNITELPGFLETTQYWQSGAELRWDTRHRASVWDTQGVRSGGSLVLGFVDYNVGIGPNSDREGVESEPNFTRVGVDLQHYIRITGGPRVIALRFYGETVTGNIDELPFAELPHIGGPDLLRGYDRDRFRDKVATVGQISYMWPALYWFVPQLFVDVGRVHPSLDDMGVGNMRCGFGIAFEAYSASGLMMRASLAGTVDGGFNAFVSFEPAFDLHRERY